jgi:hypothetical protein
MNSPPSTQNPVAGGQQVAVSDLGPGRAKGGGLQRQFLVVAGQWLVVAVLVLVIAFDVTVGVCFLFRGERFENDQCAVSMLI